MIKIVPVHQSEKLLGKFVDYPHALYKGDINYVPELFMSQRNLLSVKKNPYFQHSSMQLFLAYRHEMIVGRIAAVLNNNHNKFNKKEDGFFGFFDCEDNQEIANALLDAVTEWLGQYGTKTIVGPVNPSTNDPCGLLVDGFDNPPKIMMSYNKPYYIALLENYGLKKKVDLWAHTIAFSKVGEKPVRLHDLLTERLKNKGITIRKIDTGKNFQKELMGFGRVYNDAWNKNLGFVPLTQKELEYMGKDLKLIVNPDYCLVAEHNGEMVGVSLCVPDINQILIKIKRGRLLPTGIFKLLMLRKKINALRVMALGVTEPYRKMGIEACFYATIIKKGRENGIEMAEASWVLEHNDIMNKAIEKIGGKVYKVYRLYEKPLAEKKGILSEAI